jgi:hypothetical protein
LTLPLNLERLRLSYELVVACPPFDGWNLPESEDIKFTLCRSKDTRGYYKWHPKKKQPHEIGISVNCIGNLNSLNEVMMHEIVHLHERIVKTVSPHAMHNAAFIAWSRTICKIHELDFKLFV